MPLKLVCKHCGELMYQTSRRPNKTYGNNRYYSNLLDLCVPEIVDLKLNFTCPGCKREITNGDLEAWTVKISDARKQC